MSYAATAALQAAVYNAMIDDAAVSALSGGAIFDALPPGPVPSLYVSLGPERVRDRSDKTGQAALHDFPIKIVSTGVGFQTGKSLAAAISDALVGADLTLTHGRLVELRFLRAIARRISNGREIDIWFRALIDTSAP
jgi:hypothetical protein